MGGAVKPNKIKVMGTEINYRKVKSDTHCAIIDGKEIPVNYNKEMIFYKGRWRIIETDETGSTYVEYPGAIVYFEIKPLTQ